MANWNDNQNTIKNLAVALDEFFSPATSNERKGEIGNELSLFQQNPEAAVFAAEFLNQTCDQNLLMFLLQCLQNYTEKRWTIAKPEFKAKLRVLLLDLVPSWNRRFPSFLTSKLLKIIATIARFDWPDSFAEFSLRLSQWLLEGKNHFKSQPRDENLALTTGLRLVRTVIEEFSVAPCPYLTQSQKVKQLDQLKSILVPGILDLIQELLSVTADYLVVLSPEDSASLNGVNDPKTRFAAYSELSLSCTIRTVSFQLENVVPRAVINECLFCVSEILEYGLTNPVHLLRSNNSGQTRSLMSLIFTFGEFGTQQLTSVCGSEQTVAGLALQCLIEAVVNRPLTSVNENSDNVRDLRELNDLMTWYMFYIARSLLKEVSSKSRDELILMDDGCLTKILEFQTAFIHHRFHSLESGVQTNAEFQNTNVNKLISDYLLEFASITEACMTDGERLLSCLEFWKVFFEYLIKKVDSEYALSDQKVIHQYQGLAEKMTGIMLGVFSYGDRLDIDKTGYAGSGSLSDLPAEAIFIRDQAWDSCHDEDLEQANAESWFGLCQAGAEIVANLAFFHFDGLFASFYDAFKLRVEAYFSLEQKLHEAIRNPENEAKLLWLMADLQNLMLILSRLSCYFINQQFERNKQAGQGLVELLCQSLVFSAKMKFHDEKALGDQLRLYFAHLFSGFLLCLRSWCHWIAQFYADAQRTGENNQAVSAIITASLDTVIPLIVETVGDSSAHRFSEGSICVARCSTSLLFSLLTTVRPQSYVLNMQSVSMLYEVVSSGPEVFRNSKLPPRAMRILLASLASYLVVPWHQSIDCEQEWAIRKKMYRALVNSVFEKMLKALNQDYKDADLKVFQQDLEQLAPILVDMLTGIEEEGSKTKLIALPNFLPVANGVLRWIGHLSGNLTAENQKVSELLLQMLKSLFATFSVQLGAEFAKETVQKLLKLTDGSQCDKAGFVDLSSKATELLLEILRMIVCEMSKAFANFTESIMDLALNNLYPRIADGNLAATNSIDARQAFYKLLFCLLDSRWRHFFPSSINGVQTKKENLPPWMEPTPSTPVDHEKLLAVRAAQLNSVLQAFGRSLNEEPEPQIIKENLKCLNLLEEKWGLYKKPIFQTAMLSPFLRALCHLYASDKHPLLSEDIADTIFAMVISTEHAGQVFSGDILPRMLVGQGQEDFGIQEGQSEVILNQFVVERDIHSFCANLNRVVCQIRMCQLCNAA